MPDVAEQVVAPIVEESVASHSASFSPEAQREAAQAPVTDETPHVDETRPVSGEPRHRAKSQRATANDYQDIASATKELRSLESELAKLKPEVTDASPRVLALRRQIKGLKSELAEVAPQTPAALAAQPAAPVVSAKNVPGTFADAEPTIDQFMDQADPYAAWNRALARYDRRKEAWEADRAVVVQQEQQQTAAQQAALVAEQQAYGTRLETFRQSHPDFQQKLAAVEDRALPPVLVASIVKDDNGPAILYALLSDPVFLDEMHLLSDGKTVTDSNVALMRRRLNAQLTRASAAITGSATTMTPSSWTSRPPNPVRTSPVTTGDDPPGDGHSLAEHRKHFSKPKRR